MKCKYCGAELDADMKSCPECGKSQTDAAEEAAAQDTAAAEASAQTASAETPAESASVEAESVQESAPSEPKAEKKKANWMLGAAIAVLVIIVAMLVVKIVRDSRTPVTLPTEDSNAVVDSAGPASSPDDSSKLDSTGDGESTEIPLNGVSYTVTADALTDDVLDRVIATCGDLTLTNRDLPIYYWQQYFSFANTYGMYLSYLLDTSIPLDQQMYNEESTWQQMFLGSALDTFRYHSAMAQDAEASGYTLSDESEQLLSEMRDNLAANAEAAGYESADAYLQASFGPSVTVDDYIVFLSRYLLGSEYLSDLVAAQEPSDADVSQYYDDNADDYAQKGVEKIDKPMVNVRHILIQPAQSDDGTITDEAWADAEQEANDILNEWLSGEMTEESFSALANEHSTDPGSNTNGGLYEDVHPGQMVEAFNDWCFADGRQPGDYGIVKTNYGYHIMFFSGVGETVYWFQTAKEDYVTELSAKLEDEISAKYSFESNVDNAALVDVLFQEATDSAE